MIISVCKPDCPDRNGTCHSTCVKYLEQREKLNERKAVISKEKHDLYEFKDMLIKSKEKKRRKYHHG